MRISIKGVYMSIISIIRKLPWQFILAKVPDIIKISNEFHKKQLNKISENDIKNDFLSLEKLVMEQARLTVSISDDIKKLNEEITKIKENYFTLFLLNIALLIIMIMTIIILLLIYFK